MNINIDKNNTLYRKSTYDLQSQYPIKNKSLHKLSFIERSNIPAKLNDNMGFYIRPDNYSYYIDNFIYIKRTIQINSSNRNINYFKSPFNFTTYIANNQIANNTDLKPRIGTIIPNIYKINLSKIIIPNYYTINQELIINNALYNDIGIYLMNNSNIQINNTYFINPLNVFITIVNIVINNKINIIINYDPSFVISFLYNNNIINKIYKYNVDVDSYSKQQRLIHLNIKELNDNYDDIINNIITTFRLFPKSIKNKFLYADTKNIKKIFDNIPLKLNKFSIQLTDNNNTELKIFFLDYAIVNPNEKCICTPENKVYSCSCNYILHPLNPKYQIYIFFDFQFKDMVINYNTNNYINTHIHKN